MMENETESANQANMQIAAWVAYNALPEYRAIVDNTIAEISELLRDYQEGEAQEA